MRRFTRLTNGFSKKIKSRSYGRHSCRALQFRQNPQDVANHAEHGRWLDRSCLESCGNCDDGRQLHAATRNAALTKRKLARLNESFVAFIDRSRAQFGSLVKNYVCSSCSALLISLLPLLYYSPLSTKLDCFAGLSSFRYCRNKLS